MAYKAYLFSLIALCLSSGLNVETECLYQQVSAKVFIAKIRG